VLAGLGFAGIGIILALLWMEHRTEITLPTPTGRFAVGRTIFDWVDATWYQFPAPHANWFVWVWYPSASATEYARSTARTIAIRLARKRAIQYQKTLLFPQRELMNKKACAEKTSNSWTCLATSAPSSAFRRNIRCVS
jgi:hypothetical protein